MSKTVNSCEKSDDKSIVFEKSSFERFGDDLMELILSYLPIDEKFRLVFLSKQVQSLIFNKQIDLVMSTTDKSYKIRNHKRFEYILTKLKNLEKLTGLRIDERVIKIISEKCHKLKNISIDFRYFTDIPSDSLIYFGQKCGPTLQSFEFKGLTDEQIRQLLPFLHELRSITVGNLNTLLKDNHTDDKSGDTANKGVSKLLPELQEIRFFLFDEKVLNEFRNQYSENLLKITTDMSFDSQPELKLQSISSLLKGLGGFHKIRALDINIRVPKDIVANSIEQTGLKQLAKDCPQLRQLRFKYMGLLFQNNNLISIFSTFINLTTLEINVYPDISYEFSFQFNPSWLLPDPVNDNYTIRDLRRLSQLKHLSLSLKQLGDNCIDSIDKYLPQLVSIEIETKAVITDRSLEQLSRLKCLTHLKIFCYTYVDHNITDYGVQQLIVKCDRLRSLCFEQKNIPFDFDISEKSIEAIILKSKRMPKIQYNLDFPVYNNEKRDQLKNHLNDLPENVHVKLLYYDGYWDSYDSDDDE